MRYSKAIVTLIIFLNIVFTIVILFIFYEKGTEPTGLITAWFAFSTGELSILGLIKVMEEKKEQKKSAPPKRSVATQKNGAPLLTKIEYYASEDKNSKGENND
jgi:hypothetical protein